MAGYITRTSSTVPFPGGLAVIGGFGDGNSNIKVDQVLLFTAVRVMAGVTGGRGKATIQHMFIMQVLRAIAEVRIGC